MLAIDAGLITDTLRHQELLLYWVCHYYVLYNTIK